MKPMSPRAQRLARAYRDHNALPHDVRARLLARLAQPGVGAADASRTQLALARPPVARRLLRVLGWGGPATLLLVAIALLPRASVAPGTRDVEVVAAPGAGTPPVPLPAMAGTKEEEGRGTLQERPLAQPRAGSELKEVARRARSKARPATIKPVEVSAARAAEHEPRIELQVTSRTPGAPRAEAVAPAPLGEQAAFPAPAPAQSSFGSSSASVASYEARVTEARPRAELSLDDEVLLVRRASDLLRAGDPMRALSALAEHARLFPTGKLVTMRQAARVQALCDLGKREQARGEAAIFLAEHGDSPYAAKVRRLCVVR